MNSYELEYAYQGKKFKGYVALPENLSSLTAVVMIVHMWSGRVEFVEQKANEMAAKGLIGFAIDMYGNAATGETAEQCGALMQPFMDDRSLIGAHIQAAFAAIKQIEYADSKRVLAMGYCFGGLCVQDMARINSQLKGVISIHGLMVSHPDIKQGQFKAQVLLLHGADDPMVSDENWHALRAELNQAGCDWQKHDFGGVMHAFTNPAANDATTGTVYNKSADQRSEKLIADFIAECLT
ncbi:MAG TPA: carboxymethylenebutenolidase [Oceanospirillales bacterium]|nr:carboxymethylenebutenolidase [Oceanospirillales bacterium]